MNHNSIGDHLTEYTDVVIVGAGVAGTSTLHHLLPYTKDIVIIDAGTAPGHGFDQTVATTKNTNESYGTQPRYSGTAVFMDNNENSTGSPRPNTETLNRNAESIPCTNTTASTVAALPIVASQQEHKIIKMMVQIFACSIDTFISHHGVQGAQTYLQCTRQGLQIQKSVAKELVLDAKHSVPSLFAGTGDTILRELGSLYVAYKNDVNELRKEYNQFVSLGTDLFDDNGIEWYEVSAAGDSAILYNPDRSHSIILSKQNPFHAAIYFPNDAIIDSSQYSKLLLQYAVKVHENDTECVQSRLRSRMNTIVTNIERLDQLRPYQSNETYSTELDKSATGTMKNSDNGKMYSAVVTCFDTMTQRSYRIFCRHVVVAIGGLSVPPGCCIEDLYGIIRPCYSYLAHVPMPQPMTCQLMNDIESTNDENDPDSSRSQRSPNFFTWNFTHDWCYTDHHHIRVSGEDHYSARKGAQQAQRCQNLIRWTYEQYNTDAGDDTIKNVNGNNDLQHDASIRIPEQSGIYTETPDCAPVVGPIASDTNNTICYIVGCNAWGQAMLSYAATLVPSILGYRPMTTVEKDAMKVLSIQRFQHSIAVRTQPCV